MRLLHILPSETLESPISCELRQYEVDEVPAYEALSYCWGDSNDQHEIICNGKTHLATASLRDALFRLRQTNEARIIWADALCIAQSDDEEKSSQVRRMDSIYRRAARVVVWLGHIEDEHSSNIKHLFESMEVVSGDPDDYDSEPLVSADASATFDSSFPWHSLSVFFDNPWFRRVWCIQEIRLASDSVFYWGAEELSRYTAVRLARWEMSHWLDQKPPLFAIVPAYAWRMNLPLTSERSRLLQALSTYRRWQATDCRDKVYGLLGLMELGEERSIIPIDYEKSAREVFRDAAIGIIRWTSDLAIMADVDHDVDYDGHPEYQSWVPQWDKWQPAPFHKIRGELSPTSSAYGVYESTAPYEIMTQSYSKELVVSGSVYETVSCTKVLLGERFLQLGNIDLADSTRVRLTYPIDVFLDCWRQNVSEAAPMGSNLSPAMISLARTLTAGSIRHEFGYDYASELNERKYLRSFLDYIRLLYALSEHVAKDGFIRYDFGSSGSGWRLFAFIAGHSSYGRTLFHAKDGSVGIGPMCLREGDLVVVLEGAYTPFALRPRGENYLLLGEVYKDEIMNGELIGDMEKGIRERQQFCLV